MIITFHRIVAQQLSDWLKSQNHCLSSPRKHCTPLTSSNLPGSGPISPDRSPSKSAWGRALAEAGARGRASIARLPRWNWPHLVYIDVHIHRVYEEFTRLARD